jgi:polyisoprenoid-binding protein YceI
VLVTRPLRALIALLAILLALPGAAVAETWTIDPAHTLSGFTVRHLMVTNVRGSFDVTRGIIEYTPGDAASVKADIVIETKTVNTRNQRRDDDLRSDNFLNAEKFPSMTFKSKRVDNVRADGFVLVGDLTIRDVTREVLLKVDGPTAPVKDPQGNRRVGASATTSINRKDFGVNWHRVMEAGGVVVGDEVKIQIDVQAIEKKG